MLSFLPGSLSVVCKRCKSSLSDYDLEPGRCRCGKRIGFVRRWVLKKGLHF